MEGNGRTRRILLNYLLLLNNYPPIIIHRKTRTDYLSALGETDKSDLTKAKVEDYSLTVQFNANELIEAYWNIFL